MTEDFLSRWSRRKQAAQAAEQAKSPSHDERAALPEHAGGPDGSRNPGAPVFDPASLPPIESITAATDIRAFFAAGVPAELTRAALRRVWTSDPKIRDFVGLADYDWDFNAPGSMAGFGPLEGADGLRAQMARRIGPITAENESAEMSGPGPGAEQEAPVSDASVHDRPVQPTQTQIMTEDEPLQKIGTSQAGDELTRPDRECAAAQQQEKPKDAQSIARRKHGRALPEA